MEKATDATCLISSGRHSAASVSSLQGTRTRKPSVFELIIKGNSTLKRTVVKGTVRQGIEGDKGRLAHLLPSFSGSQRVREKPESGVIVKNKRAAFVTGVPRVSRAS